MMVDHTRVNKESSMCLSCTILKILTDKKHYIVTVTFQGHPRSKVMVPNERLYACSYLRIIVTICITGTISKILALFYKKTLLRGHVTRNALDDPKSSAVFCA